jgi:hypothetical protein
MVCVQESPEYKKIDMQLDFVFNNFFFICNPPTVTALLEFALKLYVNSINLFGIFVLI